MTQALRVAITTLGCKTNQFETESMLDQLRRAGYAVVSFQDEADIYVINTCTVTSRTDAESRRLIRRARCRNGEARIVVTGCFAQVAPGEVAGLPEVDLVIGNSEKKRLAALLRDVESMPRVIVSDIAADTEAGGLEVESFTEHTRAFLQVQNGCNAFCSYCIVPYARGRSRSVPPPTVVDTIAGFAAAGYLEVVLTGIHMGAYGADLQEPTTLARLVTDIESRRLVPRLRIGSVDPLEVTDELLAVFATSSTVCPHLHIPLQSGSDTVLARMGRGYTGRFYHDLLLRVAAAVPDIFIGTDIIAGFPGETDDEFSETVRLVESLPLAHLHVFPFSPRKGTPAADMADQVPAAVVKARAEELRRISARKEEAFYRSFVGRVLPVLMQPREREEGAVGLTRNYLSVRLPGGTPGITGECLVRIVGYAEGRLIGEVGIGSDQDLAQPGLH